MPPAPARALVPLSLVLIAVGVGGMLASAVSTSDATDRPAVRTLLPSAIAGATAPATTAPAPRAAHFTSPCPPNDTLTLAGTAIVADGHRVALIRTPTTSRLVTEGQRVDGHRVQAIVRRKLVVSKDDRRTCLTRRRGSSTTTSAAARSTARPVRETAPGRYRVDRAWLHGRLDDLKALSRDIRVAPVRARGRLQGFRVVRVCAGGIFGQLGLKAGDVLTAANGQPLDSPNRILKLYAQLPDADVVQLNLTRAGASTVLEYAIE